MRPSWDKTWMDAALAVARRSLCSRDQVGAVIVSAENRIVDTGYNGPPRGFPWSADSPCEGWCERAQKRPGPPGSALGAFLDPNYSDCPSLHAEANALMFSDRDKRIGGTIYVTSGTCGGCAKLVANSGLVRAVYLTGGHAHRDSSRWYDFLVQCGVEAEPVNYDQL